MIRKDTRDKILAQVRKEIEFARDYKEGKIANWQKNEDMYYGRKLRSTEARANVDLGQMQSFVHTLLSKIDHPLTFKFVKNKNAQYKKVNTLNSLRSYDSKRNYWHLKDIAGKKQAIIYGRAIYAYSASSINGYKPSLENVDVYDFLIDPAAGGIDIEKALYMGRGGINKTRKQLEEGKKAKFYIADEVRQLLEGSGNSTEEVQEDLNKHNRSYGNNITQSQKEISTDEKFKLMEWFTTYEGERYYLLMTPDGKRVIRCEKLKDLFKTNLWPFWTWAAYIDLTEFWTPSYCDHVREIFMAQATSINQLIDNNEQINKPQRLVDVSAIENLAELKYKKNGHIRVKAGIDINKAYQVVQTPQINTPIDVYNVLDQIAERNSGVTAASKGVEDTDGKATIYEGNQANTADRYGLLNKTYSFGYERFAQLYEAGVREHLREELSIDLLGPEGVEVVAINKDDIFDGDEEFGVVVESSTAEETMSMLEKKQKLNFLTSLAQSGLINQQKAIELQAQIVGFDDEMIRQLLDVHNYGSQEVMSEADRDIELILDGENIKPNRIANNAYKQRFVDYMQDHQEDIDNDQFMRLTQYVMKLDPIIQANLVRKLTEQNLESALGAMENQTPNEENKMTQPKNIIEATPEEITQNKLNQI